MTSQSSKETIRARPRMEDERFKPILSLFKEASRGKSTHTPCKYTLNVRIEMKVGQLILSPSLSLQHAMSAIEVRYPGF